MGGPPFNRWKQRGHTISKPARVDNGFLDPPRAFLFGGKWWQTVACGHKRGAAELCLFESSDDSLSNFTDLGALFSVNQRFCSFDENMCWHQDETVAVPMMFCPDVFPLDGKWAVIGSICALNPPGYPGCLGFGQWWVGSLSGYPPRFTPEQTGLLDYGNYFAGKTGSTMVQTGSSRRVLFAFSGWAAPTASASCGRSMLLPRELRLNGSEVLVEPVAELALLCKHGSGVHRSALGSSAPELPTLAASGSQVDRKSR